MRRRLFANAMAIAAVVLLVFGVSGAITTDYWYTRMMINGLQKDAAIVTHHIPNAASLPAYAWEMSQELSSGGSSVRVTFIDMGGSVLADSSADWESMEPHGDRPEFIAALSQGWGTAQRYSKTLAVRMLYVAAYDPDNKLVVRIAMPLAEVKRIYWTFAAFILAGLAVSLTIAAFMAGRMARQLSQPIVSLTKMTNDIASGNYPINAPDLKDPEFMELSNGLIRLSSDLNRHVGALENSNTQLTTVLSSINEGLMAVDGNGQLLFVNEAAVAMLGLGQPADLIGLEVSAAVPEGAVTELSGECLRKGRTVSTETSLPGGNLLQITASPMLRPASGCILLLMDITQLRKLENIRRDFVANVTHELRTPLTSIRGYVETLLSGSLDNQELSTKFLQIIEIESERLSNLISDLLYLSEIENAGKETGIHRFRLAQVADGVADILELMASARGVTITSNIGGDILLEANPDRIKQLLLNLADNAVKYNQPGGSVTLSAEKTHGLVRISVKDTGIGISEEHISRIFERFYRVDKGRSRSMGGTGLGLSIVKHIVDMYRGNIRLISESGKGSEFIIELPVKYEAKKRM